VIENSTIVYYSLHTSYSIKGDDPKCSFSLHWWVDYCPGHPEGEYVHRERGQMFLADPHDYGFLRPEKINNFYIGIRYNNKGEEYHHD
jgi:hypothetical protein